MDRQNASCLGFLYVKHLNKQTNKQTETKEEVKEEESVFAWLRFFGFVCLFACCLVGPSLLFVRSFVCLLCFLFL